MPPRRRFLTALPLLPAAVLAVLAAALAPLPVWSCGCGVFDVTTSAMLPTRPGGIAYLEFGYANQNKNWNGASRGSDGANPDKQIRTGFFTAGVQYMFGRAWGVMAEFPYWSRYVKAAAENGRVGGFTHSAVGDIRVRGVYSGFSEDMSSGLTFGLKLPTGDYSYPNFDRDAEIGTGSTDLLLGAYRRGRIGATDWNWIANAQWDEPVLVAGGFRPGAEVGAVAGTYYELDRIGGVRAAPTALLIGANRWRDGGALANTPNSGYRRVLLAPGLELAAGPVRVYGDVEFPVYQRVFGDQLVASELFKLNVGWAF